MLMDLISYIHLDWHLSHGESNYSTNTVQLTWEKMDQTDLVDATDLMKNVVLWRFLRIYY